MPFDVVVDVLVRGKTIVCRSCCLIRRRVCWLVDWLSD